jgi:hypothetical protein
MVGGVHGEFYLIELKEKSPQQFQFINQTVIFIQVLITQIGTFEKN